MLSKSAEYALRALHRLAWAREEEPVTAARLAERVGVPENYLAKLLHRLQQEGVVASRRGRGGGFALARPADEVTLAEVVEPFDDVMARECLLGRAECSDQEPCAAHDAWRAAVGRLRRFFLETTLEDLGEPVERAGRDGPAGGPVPGETPGSEAREEIQPTVAGG